MYVTFFLIFIKFVVIVVVVYYQIEKIGMSRRRYTVLSGSIFAYWNQIERYVRVDSNTQIRMIRLKMTDGSKIVGVLLPNDSIEQVLKDLR